MDQNFFNKVFATVKQIPIGKVATYGDIARLCGNKNMARQVGWALHSNPEPIITPCHRVVFSNGNLAKGFAVCGISVQADLLRQEGVEVINNAVDLKKYRWEI